jgi:sugar lactone lactonase YvrE
MSGGYYRVVAKDISPFSLWEDANGGVYYSDPKHHQIWKVPAVNLPPVVFAGGGTEIGGYNSGSAPVLALPFNRPHGITGDSNNLYVCDTINSAIRAIPFSDTANSAVVTIGNILNH